MIITALAILIAVAGYISFTQANPDNQDPTATEQPASSDELLDLSEEDLAADIFTDTEDSNTEDADVEDHSDAGTTVLTSASSDTAAQMKLNREQTRSKNKETLLEIINSDKVTDNQKQDAIDQLEKMTDIAEKESAAENLLMAKGFTDVVVIISQDGADVVLTMPDASEAKRAQIEDIVKRKTGISAENIVITPIATK